MTEFGELSEDGYVKRGTLDQSRMLACPNFIIDLDHYLPDEGCRCTNPEAVEMFEWGYTWNGKVWA